MVPTQDNSSGQGRPVEFHNSSGAQVGDQNKQINAETYIERQVVQAPAVGVGRTAPGPANAQAMAMLCHAKPVPRLPNEFVTRPETLRRPLHLLLEEPPPPSRGRVIALTGMSGSGKTLLAQAIGINQKVRKRFGHHVVWVSLNRGSSSATELERILRALGETLPEGASARDVSALLQSRLARRRCLIILDDVSAPEDIELFNVVGPESALLVTSNRLPRVAGVENCPVEECDPPTARQLLGAYSGHDLTTQPEAAAAAVLDRCAGLALALAICGALVRSPGGWEWADVAESLRQAEFGRLEAHLPEYKSLHAALRVGVAALTPADRELYRTLAVFDGQGAVPVSAAKKLWSGPGLDSRGVREKIMAFAQRSLLTYEADQRVFRLHDLLSQYMVSDVGAAGLRELHLQLAEAYLSEWGGFDAGLPEISASEDYGLAHLASHLDRAGRHDLLHRLLAAQRATAAGGKESAWYAAHDQAGRGEQYLSDLDLAWRRAREAADASGTPAERARDRALEMRYALARSSIVGIAASAPPPLLAALVERGVWTFAKARAYAEALPTATARASALAALARLPDDCVADRSMLLVQARTAAEAIEQAGSRAWALARLVPCAPEQDRKPLFAAALDAADVDGSAESADVFRSRQLRAWLLVRMAPHVPELVRDRGADIRAGIDGATLVEALALVTEHVPGLRGELSSAIRGLRRPEMHPGTIAEVLPVAPEADRATLLSYAWDWVAGSGEQSPSRPRDASDAMALASALLTMEEHGSARARLLAALLPLVAENRRRDLVNGIVKATRDRGRRAGRETMKAVFPVLRETDRAMLIDEVVRPDPALWTLCAIARYLPEDLLAQAAEGACGVRNDFYRTQAFEALAPAMPARLLNRALRTMVGLDTPEERGLQLARLIGRIPPQTQAPALTVITETRVADSRAALLASVALSLPPSLAARAAAAVPPDADPDFRAFALNLLATTTTGAARASLFAEAKQAACGSAGRPEPLRNLATSAEDPRQLTNVLLLVRVLEGHMGPREAANLNGLASRLPGGALEEAVRIAHTMTDHCKSSRALAGLVGCTAGPLRASLLKDALDASCAPHHHADRVRCRIHQPLREAAEQVPEDERVELPGGYLAEVMARTATATPASPWDGLEYDEDQRIRQVICVLTYLPENQRERSAAEALRELRQARPEWDQVEALIALPPFLAAEHSAELARLAEALSGPSDQGRALAAVALHAPGPASTEIIDRALAADRADQVQLWPSLIPVMVAPRLREPKKSAVLAEAMQRVAVLRDDGKAEQLIELIPCLPAALLRKASDIAATIGSPKKRADAYGALARAVKPDEPGHWGYWRAALDAAVAADRATVLKVAVDACLAVGGEVPSGTTEPTAAYLATAVLDTLRWWPGSSHSAKTGPSALAELIVGAVEEATIGIEDQEEWMSDWPPQRILR